MIDRRTIFDIHRLAHDGLSVRKIAATLGLSRPTVHKYLDGFVKLLKRRRSLDKQVPLPGPTHPLGSPLCTRNLAPTLEAIPHLFAVLRR